MADNLNLDGTEQNTVNGTDTSGTVKGVNDNLEESGKTVSDSTKNCDSATNNSDCKPKRNNVDNLVSLGDRTTEEQRKIAIMGGKASGEARRKKKHMREIAQNLLAHNMREDQIEEVLGTAKDLLDGDLSVAAVLTARMIQEAADGNYKAFEVLRDTAGYKPKDQVEVENVSEADKLLLERIAQRVGLHNSTNSAQITG